ncbi:AMP-binding protein [Nocardia huaxiensis]|uniref:AMP-binding protein n=1 Tax=Nocardia huaxiensis TaxID=2755382 RepID=UPI001E5781CA|nr:AMP-binding protein [Nocardia huaxiensis]UFS97783.1 AMP-binding protein [Nocardia huaxiensis]
MTSEIIDVSTRIAAPRDELWKLLTDPPRWSRFFTGVGTATRVTETGGGLRYVVTVGGHGFPVRHTGFGLRVIRVGSGFRLDGTDGRWFLSVRLRADPTDGATHIGATLFGMAHPELVRYRDAAVSAWLHAGLTRMADYLNNAPTGIVRNSGELRSVPLSVARTVTATKVVNPFVRPDRGLAQLAALARWGFTLQGGYAAARAHSPDSAAIIDDSGSHDFLRMHLRSTWIAEGMARKGIRAGSVVGILARNHAGMVEIMVACGKLGVDAVLLNTGLGARQIEELAYRHRPAALFLDDEFDSVARYLPVDTLCIATGSESVVAGRISVADLLRDIGTGFPRPPRPGKQIVLTAGTTGAPKVAVRPDPKGFGTVAAMLSRLPLRMGERMLIASPLFHSWGLGLLQISTPLRATVVLQSRFDPESCLRAIAEHRCTSLMAVPVMLQRLLEVPPQVRARYDTSSLRVIASSGSPLIGSLANQIMDAFGDILYNFYGSTEVSWATVADPTDLRLTPGTAGRPDLGTAIAIVDDNDAVLPVGATGRVFVGNGMLFDGYLNAADPRRRQGLMDTGDLGYLDAEGRLFVRGRGDEMIISGGEKVFPLAVEDALARLPHIREVAVVGVPDTDFGQRLAAFVVPRTGVDLDADLLRRYIRTRLSRFAVPRDITFLNSLPRNTTGKILKRTLIS